MDNKTKFNWVTPLLFYLLFLTLFFLFWGSNTYAPSNVGVELFGSAFISLICVGVPIIISILVYHSDKLAGERRSGWHSKYFSLLLVPIVIGFGVRIAMTNPETRDNRKSMQYYKDGMEYLRNKEYPAAVFSFENFIASYPDSPRAKKVAEQLPELRIESIKYYSNEGSYFSALSSLFEYQLEETSEGKELYGSIVSGLSQDKGENGQAYLRAMSDNACLSAVSKDTVNPTFHNETVKFSDIHMALQPPEKEKALLCEDLCINQTECTTDLVQLPAELLATYPAELGYVVLETRHEENIETCEYQLEMQKTEFGTITQKVGEIERLRVIVSVDIYRVSDGKKLASHDFRGSSPDSCPETESFSYVQNGPAISDSAPGGLHGEDPETGDILEWIISQFGNL